MSHIKASGTHMRYIRIYKTVYLIIITINLVLSFRGYVNYAPEYLVPHGINILVIGINVFTFINLKYKLPKYIITIETILSILRMTAILFIASLIFMGPTIQIIPTNFVLWIPILQMKPSREVIWLVCLTLLIFEILFFRKLKQLHVNSIKES